MWITSLILSSLAGVMPTHPAYHVSPQLIQLESQGVTRFLVFQKCGHENCHHTFFVQEVSDDPTPRLLCTKPIQDLNSFNDLLIEGFTWTEDFGVASVRFSSSHGAFEHVESTLRFSSGCQFELSNTPSYEEE